MVLEKTLESHWIARRSNQSILKEISPEYSLEGLMLKLRPNTWLPDVKSRLIGNDPDAGKDRGQEEKRVTEDEMVGWHLGCNGHEFEQALGAGDGQGTLACCSPWGHKEEDMTERLNNKKIFVCGTSLKSLLILLQYCFCPTFWFFWP